MTNLEKLPGNGKVRSLAPERARSLGRQSRAPMRRRRQKVARLHRVGKSEVKTQNAGTTGWRRSPITEMEPRLSFRAFSEESGCMGGAKGGRSFRRSLCHPPTQIPPIVGMTARCMSAPPVFANRNH